MEVRKYENGTRDQDTEIRLANPSVGTYLPTYAHQSWGGNEVAI